MAVRPILLVLLVASAKCTCNYPDQELHHDLFNGYNKEARPYTHDHSTVDVQMGLYLHSIVGFEKNVLTIDVWLFMFWTDPRLAWDPEKYNNLTSTASHATNIWIPDVVLYNSATVFNELHHSAYPAQINSSGRVTFVPQERLNVLCQENSVNEESGEIHCTLVFGSWIQNSNLLSLNYTSNSVGTDEYVRANDWRFIDSKVEAVTLKYNCCPHEYSNLRYEVTLKHKYHDC